MYIPHVAHTQIFEEILSTDFVRAIRRPRPSLPYAVVLFTLFYEAAFEAKGFFASAISMLNDFLTICGGWPMAESWWTERSTGGLNVSSRSAVWRAAKEDHRTVRSTTMSVV